MSIFDSIGNLLEGLRTLMDSHQSEIQTMLPGIIVSYDSVKTTAVVQPAIMGNQTLATGVKKPVAMPQLLDVPVHFPGGGGVTLTFPVKAGDECMVHFSSRDMSAWWQSGGVQPTIDARKHDLSDAFCQVGVRSQARLLPGGAHADHVELRSEDGTRKISIDPGGDVTVAGAQGVHVTGSTTISLTSPTLTHNGVNISSNHTHSTPSGQSGPPQ